MLTKNIAQFLEYFKSIGYSRKSLEGLNTQLGRFNSYLNEKGISSLTDISYSLLLDFITSGRATSRSVTKTRVWALKQFFQFLMLKGVISRNIAADLPYPRIEKKECQFLSLSDFQKLLTHLANQLQQKNGLRNLILFLLLGILGLRNSTVRLLDREDVDLTYGRLFVQEKGGGSRYIVLPQILAELLYAYLLQRADSRKALLLSSRGKRLSQRALQDILSQTARACGITYHLHPHLFRHTAATYLNQAAGIAVTRQVLGHQREKNTRKYIHLNVNKYARYMRRHPFIQDNPQSSNLK